MYMSMDHLQKMMGKAQEEGDYRWLYSLIEQYIDADKTDDIKRDEGVGQEALQIARQLVRQGGGGKTRPVQGYTVPRRRSTTHKTFDEARFGTRTHGEHFKRARELYEHGAGESYDRAAARRELSHAAGLDVVREGKRQGVDVSVNPLSARLPQRAGGGMSEHAFAPVDPYYDVSHPAATHNSYLFEATMADGGNNARHTHARYYPPIDLLVDHGNPALDTY